MLYEGLGPRVLDKDPSQEVDTPGKNVESRLKADAWLGQVEGHQIAGPAGVGPNGLGDGEVELGSLLGGSWGPLAAIEPRGKDKSLDDFLLGRPRPAVEGNFLAESGGSGDVLGQCAAVDVGRRVEMSPWVSSGEDHLDANVDMLPDFLAESEMCVR